MNSVSLKTKTKAVLLKPAFFFNTNFAYVARMEMAFARGALNVATRSVDPTNPVSGEDAPENVDGVAFAENTTQLRRHNQPWEGQFAKISHLPYVAISGA